MIYWANPIFCNGRHGPTWGAQDGGHRAASARDDRRNTMMTKIRIALVAALLASTASAALARTTHYQAGSYGNAAVTDEGQGRFAPADGGAP
jgi:hypothetical protein